MSEIMNATARPTHSVSSLPSVGELTSQAFNILQSHSKKFVAIYLIQLVLGLTVTGFIMLTTLLAPDFLNLSDAGSVVGAIILAVFAGLAGVIIQAWPQLVLITIIAYRNEQISVREAFKRTQPLLFPFLWMVFLETFMIFTGFLFFIIPGLILFVSFIFARYVFLVDGERGLRALLKSHAYLSVDRGGILLRYFVVIAVSIVLEVCLQIVNAAILPKESASFLIQQSQWVDMGIKLILKLLEFIFSNTISFFIAVYTYLLFEHVKRIKGDFEFVPSQSTKTIFKIIAITGAVIFLLILILGTAAGILFSKGLAQHPSKSSGPLRPDQQFISARDAQRKADLFGIANALDLYRQDHNGKLPDNDGNDSLDSFPSFPTCIGGNPECFYLKNHLVPKYISTIPEDQNIGTEKNTGYFVYVNETGAIIVSAKSEATGKDIIVERKKSL